MGPYYQAFPEGGSLTIYDDDPARTYDEIARWSKKDAEALAEVERLAGRPRRRAGPAAARRCRPPSGRHRPPTWPTSPRLVWRNRGVDVRTVADVTRLMTHEHRRPARRLVRVAAGQGRAGGQRRDRHLGRALRAGHGVRDGPPLDRRRRRRPARQLGLPRGRHGRGLRGDPAGRPSRSAPRSAPTRRVERVLVPRRPGHGRGAGGRRGARAPRWW